MAEYIGSGGVITSGSAASIHRDSYLLNFKSLSKNRKYNVGLDENNKYPEDYITNYADIMKAK